MIVKQTVIDQVEIRRDGTIQIRFGLLLIEDGVEIDSKWHRTVVPPGTDLDAQIAAVNTHLISMGKAEIDPSEIDRVKAVLPVVQTKAVVQAYHLKLAEGALAVETMAATQVRAKI